jgi:hypothetical protein
MKTHLLRFAFLFVGLAFITQSHAGEYYTYQDRDGKLVISNQKPPSGSKIIKQQTLLDLPDNQIQEARRGDADEPLKPDKSQVVK